MERVETVIRRGDAEVERVRQEVKSRCEGKVGDALCRRFPGPSLSGALRGDRHEDRFGRVRVRPPGRLRRPEGDPQHRVDADTRNIEELTVVARRRRGTGRAKTKPKSNGCARRGIRFSDYEGMMPRDGGQRLIIDDLNHYEAEVLMEKYKPDIFCAGIKEKYVIQKAGIPLKQLHSYDYSGPYAGFKGADQFLPGDRPDGQLEDFRLREGALAGEPRAGRQLRMEHVREWVRERAEDVTEFKSQSRIRRLDPGKCPGTARSGR